MRLNSAKDPRPQSRDRSSSRCRAAVISGCGCGKVPAHRPNPEHKGQPGEFLPGLPQVQFEGHGPRGGEAQGLVADGHDRGSIPQGHARQLTRLVTGGHLKEFGHQDFDQRRAAGRGGADPDECARPAGKTAPG